MADAGHEPTGAPGRRPGAFTIARATSPPDVAAVATLFREYTDSLGLDLSYQGFAAELAGLPGAYGPPRGVLLLARRAGDGEDTPLGCVAVRPLPYGASPGRCELKRMYVRPAARGSGLGRSLAQRALAEAEAMGGYDEMVLDMLGSSRAAQQLYESMGFTRTEAYYTTPVAETVFYRRRLRGRGACAVGCCTPYE